MKISKEKLLSYKDLILIKTAGLICIPAIFTGFYLSDLYGFYSTIIGIFFSGVFLFLISLLFGKLSNNNKGLSTVEIINKNFSRLGQVLGTIGIIIPMVGWFSLQINLLVDFLLKISNFSFLFLTIFIGFFITVFVLKGIKSLKFISDYSIYIKLFVVFGIYIKFFNFNISEEIFCGKDLMNSYKIIFYILASVISGIIDLPTVFRYAKSSKDIYYSCLVSKVLFFPLILFTGVFLEKIFPGKDFTEAIYFLYESEFFKFIVFIFMILSTISINIYNLYSSSTALSSIKELNINYFKSVLILGFIGTLIALFSIINNFLEFLDFINLINISTGTILLIGNEFKIYNKKINSYILLFSITFVLFFNVTGFKFLNIFLLTFILKIIEIFLFKLKGFLNEKYK